MAETTGKFILLADDDHRPKAYISLLVNNRLETEGIEGVEIRTVDSGAEAVRVILMGQEGLIAAVLDNNMRPGPRGVDIADIAIREGIPVSLYSSDYYPRNSFDFPTFEKPVGAPKVADWVLAQVKKALNQLP